MFAISFDMNISELKLYYGEPYNNAYYEIKELLKKDGSFGFKEVLILQKAKISAI